MIVTGKLVSEGMPVEAGKYVAGITPKREKAETHFTAGDITSIGDRILEQIDQCVFNHSRVCKKIWNTG